METQQQPLLPPVVAPLLVLLPLLCYLLLLSWTRKHRGAAEERRGRAPPGPPEQLPVLGNLLQIGSRPHRYFQAVARRYGPVVEVRLGRVRAVVVSSPEAAKELLRINDQHCCSRPNSPGPRMLSYNFLDVAFSPYSDYWREMRKLFILELLSMRRVQSFVYARAAEVDHLIASLAAAGVSNSSGSSPHHQPGTARGGATGGGGQGPGPP